jgi:hypothetical protein
MSVQKYQVSSRCPVCGDQMYVTRLECGNCHSALEGKFTLGAFQNLTPDHLQFLEVFIRCRGQNKAVQDLLNISYPTVVKKLDEVIIALGYEIDPEESRRRDILERLRQNELTPIQAQQMLSELNASKPTEAKRGE